MIENFDGKIITIFGGSKCKEDSAEYRDAKDLGARLADVGFTICTGGYLGIMEAASRGAGDECASELIAAILQGIGRPVREHDIELHYHTLRQLERLTVPDGPKLGLAKVLHTSLGREPRARGQFFRFEPSNR